MEKDDTLVANYLDELKNNPSEKKIKEIITKLFELYLKGVSVLNRADIAKVAGEHQNNSKSSKEMNLHFINDKNYIVRCEGFENIQYDKNNYNDVLLTKLNEERNIIAKGYLYTAIRNHMNEIFYNIFKQRINRVKRPNLLSTIYCSIMEYENNFNYFDELLSLFHKTNKPTEKYQILNEILDFKLSVKLRPRFLNELTKVLKDVNPKYGFYKDLKKYIKLLSNSKTWKNSKKKLSIWHITGDY